MTLRIEHALSIEHQLATSFIKHNQSTIITNIVIPFRLINKLVTRRSASRGDDLLKNFGGVMLGGSVVGFLLAVASHALIDP